MAVLFYRAVARLFGVVIMPEDSIGIVNKKYVLVGQNRTLPAGAIIALNGEAGLQADALAPGLHFGLWPWQYVVTLQKFITISQDTIGVVEARDGHPLKDGHVLARRVDCNSFQDARAFLEGGGERGPQMTVIPPGTYRINTALFTVQAVKVLDIPDNMLGIVTTKEGRPLAAGEIASPPVDGHNSFQDAQAFVDAGGGKGLQEQVMLAGRYFINPRFATVEIKETTIVPIANVGVVIAYVGREGRGRDRRRVQARQSGEQGREGRVGRAARSGQVSDQPVHAPRGDRPDRQRRAELGDRQDRGAQSRQESVHDYGAVVRRLHVQPGRQPDHSHSALGRAEGDRAVRQHGEPGDAGARADDRQLLPQRRAGLRRHRLPADATRAAGRCQEADLRRR